MTNEDDGPTALHRPRFQFSLATLILAVTLVSVLCGLAVWLGSPSIILLMLAIGPVGGTIIVRVRRSSRDWAVTYYSGVVTVLFWVIVAVVLGVIGGFSGPSESVGAVAVMTAAATLYLSPFAFAIGITTGVLWEMTAGVTTAIWRSIVKRCCPGPRSDGEYWPR